jgi:shikimate dehydrogenase
MVMAAPFARRELLGLIGYPIKHSASPAMHEAAARAAGFSAWYQLIERPGLDASGLGEVLDGIRAIGFAGINVTYPYKEAIVPLLDELSPLARHVGAVNTVVVSNGRLVGHNTDCTGFAAAYAALGADKALGTDKARDMRPDTAVALIGAGGVGRAIAVALAKPEGPEIRIVDQDAAKAQALADTLAGTCPVRVVSTVEAAIEGASGIINATPAGMIPHVETTAVPVHLIRPEHWVADAVYVPLWTAFLKAAHLRGARILTGRDLAIAQAADAFRLFTGVDPSREAMAGAFDQIVQPRSGNPLAA